MSWSTSVVCGVSSDTEPTVVINFDSGKYVFNAGESTGRSFIQSRQHDWRKTRGVFLTSLGTQRGAGLAGLLMFLADTSQPKMTIAGPPGMLHFVASMRAYLNRHNMYVNCIEAESSGRHGGLQPEPVFEDENLKIYGIPLMAAPADAASALEAGSKRKRSPSPDLPSKRGKPTDDTSSDASTLLERSRKPGFSPSSLTGVDAQEWRKMIIKTMFNPKEPDAKELKAKKDANAKGPFGMKPPVSQVSAPVTERDVHKPSWEHVSAQLPKLDAPKMSLCYVCVGPRARGKFDSEKAKKLQIPQGRIRSRLTSGETISFMVEDGNGGQTERTVRPEEVIGPSDAPKVVMIFDVPTRDHIPSLVSAFEISPFYNTFLGTEHAEEHVVRCIYHLCGEGVLEDERYKALLGKFAPDVQHVVASREHCPDPVSFTTAAYNQLRLNRLDPEMFPTQRFSSGPFKQLTDVPGLPENTTQMYTDFFLQVRPAGQPRIGRHAAGIDPFQPIVNSTEPLELPAPTQEAFEAARERGIKALEGRESKPGDDVMIIPLGTGSAIPTRHRNVSATLIQIPNHGNILLDAGEGTWGQLTRLFGDDPERKNGVWEVLRGLKCIFLSHAHGDHHIGAAKILAMRQKLSPRPTGPLYVVSIRPVLLYLHEYQEFEDLGLGRYDGTGVETVLSDTIHWDGFTRGYGGVPVMPWQDETLNNLTKSAMCDALGLSDFLTCHVDHRVRAYGCVIKHNDRWSITFSGDTRPIDSLARAGMGSTVLIHEATMADEEKDMAIEKRHSTISEAIGIGRKMRAENIMLTHFSARYPNRAPQELDPDAPPSPGGTPAPVVALAFDHARVRIGEFAKLRAYLPAIEQSVKDVAAEDPADDDELELDPTKASW